MTSTYEQPVTLADADPRDRSLVDDVRALAGSARSLAEAELAYQKARAAYAAGEARNLAILGGLAAVLAFFALMALTFGLVLGLSQAIGPWLATAIVCGTLAATAFAILLVVRSRSATMKAHLADSAEKKP